ncbi:uncharacterized protein N7477_001187 [Penicillium maclennaniae]|uniref:uncharacterized protein n=1 Tax=Penicillium maclennaniae TaxID=1343394 RepID=UPI0025419909|nr:uncharacterized protein N7477_001187 [Penicillium maclennaniae]KAJ5684842.1 hypothetical protein N7477_001187 [Penicillium maclennaniae]
MSVVTSELVFSSETQISLPSPLVGDMDTTDLDCFDVECVVEAIGSSARAIRTILNRLRSTPNIVTLYAKFTNVPPDVAKLTLQKGCRQMYNPDTRGMIVTIPGKPHDSIAGEFYTEFAIAAYHANLVRKFWSLARGRIQGTLCSKEPDGAWAPEQLPPGRSDTWPSIVLEVGVSESKKKLRADAAWWLANSNGQVQVVILISVNQTVAVVTFESIVLQQPPTYIETRQSIVVSRTPGGAGQPITTVPIVSLRITVAELLCRPPNPGEIDLQIPVSSLELIASAAWRWQGL